MKALLILFITVGWICLATQRIDARTTEAHEEVTSSKLLAVAEHKNSYQFPLDSLKYEVKLGRKVEVGSTTGAKNVKINNLTGKNKRDPAVGSAAEGDSNEATNKMGNGIMSYDDDNESFGSYGHPSGSFTNTHHVYPDYKRPPH